MATQGLDRIAIHTLPQGHVTVVYHGFLSGLMTYFPPPSIVDIDPTHANDVRVIKYVGRLNEKTNPTEWTWDLTTTWLRSVAGNNMRYYRYSGSVRHMSVSSTATTLYVGWERIVHRNGSRANVAE